jgi:O-antigen ligase
MARMTALSDHLRGRLFNLIGVIRYHLLERHYIYTIRIGLVATTLALTFVAAFLITRKGEIGFGIVGAIAAVCGVVFVYRYFAYSVLALIITTTIAAPEIPRDITTTLLLLILLTLIWIARLLLVERSFQSLRPAPVNRFVPLFALAVIISFLWSNYYADAQIAHLQSDKLLPRLVTTLVMILSPVATLLFANFVRTTAAMKHLIGYYLIFGAFVMLSRLIGLQLPMNFNTGGQLPVWVGLFALGQVLYNNTLSRPQKLALMALTAGWIYVSFFLERTWLSGWLPLFIGIAVITFIRSRIMFVTILAIAAVYIATNSQMLDTLLAEESSESGETRLAAGNFTIDIANQHFLFGTGPTGYYFYMKAYLKDLFQLSHNNYVDIYAQTGIFGFVSYLLIWGSIGWTVLRTYRLVPKRGFERGLAVSLVAVFFVTLTIMMLGDWVTPFTYTQTMRGLSYTIWPWLWAGLAIALNHISSTTNTPQS